MTRRKISTARRAEVVTWMRSTQASAREAIDHFDLEVAPRTVQLWRKRMETAVAPASKPAPSPTRISAAPSISPPWATADTATRRRALELLRARAITLLEAELAVHLARRRGLLEAPLVLRDGPPVEGDDEEREALERRRKLERAVELLTEGDEAYSTKEVAKHLDLTVAQVRAAVVDWWADTDLDAAQVARRIGTSAAEVRRWRVRAVRPADAQEMELHEGQSGAIRPSFRNLTVIFEQRDWWQSRLRWCEFSHRALLRDGASDDWIELTDAHLLDMERMLCEDFAVDWSSDVIHKAVMWWARRHRWHPVRAYLDSLHWDGIPRLDRMLVTHFGCEDDELTAPFGRKWLISAVARVRDPGCKVDTVLTLCGRQGAFKSTAFETLVGQAWFSDDKLDVGSKDGLMLMEGKWLIELAELDSLSRSEMTTVKAWITRKVDRFRAPFGRLPESHARQCILVGTTNELQPLRDPTGGRRYWMRDAHREADIAAIERDRDQLWAEAAYLYDRHRGERCHWWLTPEEKRLANALVQRKTPASTWAVLLEDWLEGKPGVQPTTVDLLGALGHTGATSRGWETRALGECMREIGWEQYQPHNGPRRWRRVVATG